MLRAEAAALLALEATLDARFDAVVDRLAALDGRVVVTGVGKSGLIGRKIAATLASTGTPAFFLHPGDARHGDVGMVVRGDLALALSRSGETEELVSILPALARRGAGIVAITADPSSRLARAAEQVLLLPDVPEACPFGATPTTSTTATLALGDALAVALMRRRGVDEAAFAEAHPAGALGRRLRPVREVMRVGAALPLVEEQRSMRDVLIHISTLGLGVTGVTAEGRLVGVITDGDLRRGLARTPDLLACTAAEVMTRSPKHISGDTRVSHAIAEMQRLSITCLFVLGDGGEPVGIVTLHDLLRVGG